jgi:hypothetical protein
VSQLLSMKYIAVAILHTTAMRHIIVMLGAMWAPHKTDIRNVELRHEIKDRTRVMRRIQYQMINDADMNAWLVSDALSDSCRSMCRLLGNVWVESRHTSLQRCTTSHRRMQQMHLSHTDISLSLHVCLLLISTSRLLPISPCLVAVTTNAVTDGSLLQQLRRLLFLLMLDVILMQASSMLMYGGICCTRYVCMLYSAMMAILWGTRHRYPHCCETVMRAELESRRS